MHGEERKWVDEAIDTNWVSTVGKNIDETERQISEIVGTRYAVALSNGTAALHLATKLAAEKLYGQARPEKGTLQGKRVFCSDTTFDASINPVAYEDGEAVFIDTEYDTWNMSPEALKKAFELYPDTRLVVLAHLYGTPGKVNEIRKMPILESKEMAYLETRIPELMGVKKILDKYKNLVLNVRVGGTDWSSVFGMRRGINYTIYDIMTVSDCLKDVLNVFSRHNDYSVSGPVWEYFRAKKDMKFEEAPMSINKSLFKQQTLINDAVDGLLKELLLDRANGFIGKTIIHPTHIPYVNGMLSVTREVYEDALQVLGTSGGVIKSMSGNKMNEIGPHRCWAEKIVMRAKAYGVIEDESKYIDLFD
jgi:citrate lyase beta subunit